MDELWDVRVRAAEPRERGVVLWITGLSEVTTSVIAGATYAGLKAQCPNVVYLDGESVRGVVVDGLGHAPGDRLVNARRLSRLCRLLSEQGLHVVCATTCSFPECHTWNRQNIWRYFEVDVQAPMDALLGRERRGVYPEGSWGVPRTAAQEAPLDEPHFPDLVIRHVGAEGECAEIAEQIVEASGVLAPQAARASGS